MVIDRPGRNVVGQALLQFMRGEIQSYEFDDRISPYYCRKGTLDASLRQTANTLWQFYDGFIDHPISVKADGWEMMRRTLAFLQTDLEVKNPPVETWPFINAEQWCEYQTLVDALELPVFDPVIHSRWRQPWWNRVPTLVGLGLIALGVLVMLLMGRLIVFFTQ